IRGQGVFQHDGFERKPSGVNTERYNGMVKYQPFKKTTIAAGVAYYDSIGNRPNFAPPRDYISLLGATPKPPGGPPAHIIPVGRKALGPFGTFPNTAYPATAPDYFENTFTGSGRAQLYIDRSGVAYWGAPSGFSNTTPLAGATTAGPTSGGLRYLMATAPQA